MRACVHCLHPYGCCVALYRTTVCKKSPCTCLCWPQLFMIPPYLFVYLLGYLSSNLLPFIYLFFFLFLLPWALKQLDHASRMRLWCKCVLIFKMYRVCPCCSSSWRGLAVAPRSVSRATVRRCAFENAPSVARGTESSSTVPPPLLHPGP